MKKQLSLASRFSPSVSRIRLLSAFTLIELLIVVAIIAILAAIAVPNLLEAQARSKVSRSLNDMRTLATALESYAVDYNAYPPHGEIMRNGVDHFIATSAGLYTIEYTPWSLLTTPVAYLTSVLLDPCVTDLNALNDQSQPGFGSPETVPLLKGYSYIDSVLMREILLGKGFTDSANAINPTYGGWRLYSAGPDHDKGQDAKTSIPYDPTNGTVSNGDLLRSQRNPLELLSKDEGS